MLTDSRIPSMITRKRIFVALIGVIIFSGVVLFEICCICPLSSLEQNVEALVEGEDIVTITCLPEDDSICVSLIEDVIRIDYYFSPH